MPEFSIVIPVFNRERVLARALNSCLDQQYADFEVVVVDDGSTDASVSVAQSFNRPRVKLVRHQVNRGHGAARNTGVQAASGDWIVSLDSDDELLPQALSRMSEAARRAGDAVGRMGFMFKRDDGRVSPLPPLCDEILDYANFLAWQEERVLFDFLTCTRRETFDSVRWEERVWGSYTLYHLDFALRFRTLFSSEVLAMVHTESEDRLSWRRRKPSNALSAAAQLGEEMDQLLSRHGEGLRRFAPRTLQKYQRLRASYHFLVGATWPGVKQAVRCLRQTPLSLGPWLLLFLGLAGPRFFAEVRSWKAPPT